GSGGSGPERFVALHERNLSATRAYRLRAATTSGRSTNSSGVCERRDVPGPTLTASRCERKHQSLHVGDPYVATPGTTSWIAANRREPLGVSTGTSRLLVTATWQ